MKTLKTALSLLMVFCMLLSFGTVAFADVVVATPDGQSEGSEAHLGILEGSASISYTDPNKPSPPSPSGSSGLDLGSGGLDLGSGVPDLGSGDPSGNPGTGSILSSGLTVTTTIPDPAAAPAPAPAEAPAAASTDAGVVVKDEGSSISITQEGVALNPSPINADTITAIYACSSSDTDKTRLSVNGFYNKIEGYTSNTPVTVEGDIEASETAITAYAFDGNTMQITVNGNATSTSEAYSVIRVDSQKGNTTVTVNGNVSGKDTGIRAYAADNGTSTVTVNGNVTSDGATGTGIVCNSPAAPVTVTVTGDVAGSLYGIHVWGSNYDITVGSRDENGAVTGGTVTGGIKLDDNVTDANTSVTVWKADKIEGDKGVVKKVINYLVALVQPDEGKISSSAPTVKQGEKVYVSSASDDYEIESAFSIGDNGNADLEKDDKGFYYSVDEPGGGIKLSAILKKIFKPEPQPDPKPDPKPVAAATNDWSDGYYLFNKAVVKQIKNAEDGGTVTVDATSWASFMRMVFEALAEHPTVTLVVKYGNNKELTVPAGADILSAIGDAQDVLFTKLAKLV